MLALWGLIRDVLTGVFLRASGALGVGDDLTLVELSGRVEERVPELTPTPGPRGDLESAE